jgi:sigma-E factor negative regulatory protein RseA
MNDALKMQISAFVDGELPENESELLLRRLSQDAALRTQVDQYLSIGRLIRREREVPGMSDLRRRIAHSLGEEPGEIPAREEPASRRLLKPVAGLAIAASVALVALVGLRQADVPGAGETAAENAPAPQAATEQVAGYTEPLPADAASSRPGEMLTQYYLSHGATSADLGANGILTRLVTLELREGELVETPPEAAQPGTAEEAIDPEADKDGESADDKP